MVSENNPKDNHGQQSRLIGFGLLATCPMAAFFLSLSWLAGGNAFMETLYGHEALALALAGTLYGIVLTLRSSKQPRVESSAARQIMQKASQV